MFSLVMWGREGGTATHCFFRPVCCEEEEERGTSVRCRVVWGPFPLVGRVAFPYVPVCAVASRVVRSVLRGLVFACRLGPSLCTILLGGVACLFVRGRVYAICALSSLFDGGRSGGPGAFSRFKPAVGDRGRARVVVGPSPPPRPTWVHARQSSRVMLWVGAVAMRIGPLRVLYFACVDPPLLPSSLCHAVYVHCVLLVYRWGRGLVPLLPVGVI